MPNKLLKRSMQSAFIAYIISLFTGKKKSKMSGFDQPGIKKLYTENDRDLPILPIPDLADTCARYLKTIKPLVSDAEFAEHSAMVEKFQSNEGAELHKLLVETEAARKKDQYPYSFLEKYWDQMYLESRCPTPVHINPFFGITDEKDSAKQEQCLRAGNFISNFTRWSRFLLDGSLEPDKGACSSAFSRMAFCAKVPREGMDELKIFPESRHVIIMCNGHIFKLEVLSAEGTLLNTNDIVEKLKAIKVLSSTAATGNLIQLFTGGDRNEWASARAELEKDHTNSINLAEIDAGILVVCLDPEPADPDSGKEKGQMLLAGDAKNRWFDKHQLIINDAGGMGFNFEHSSSDGTIWGRFIGEVMCASEGKDSGKRALPELTAHAGGSTPKRLKFNMGDQGPACQSALKTFTELTGDVDLQFLPFKEFGKNEIKTLNCSPDAYVQMAFQAAYYSLHGTAPPTYEACATRKFFHGRTETIRSCTADTLAMCKAIADGTATAESIQTAAKTHGGISKEASNGAGVDRHFYAMANLAAEKGVAVPALFSDPLFVKSKTWALSTSNGTAPYLDSFGFGPVGPDCYGLGYLVNGNDIAINITSFKSTKETDSNKMKAAINDMLVKMQKIIKP